MSPPNTTQPLTRDTLLPLGMAAALILAAVTCTWYLSSLLNEIRSDVKSALNDRWSTSDMERWAYRLEKDNRETGIIVPDPRKSQERR